MTSAVWATAARVARQLRHDRRTVALLLAVPSLLLVLLRYVLDSAERFAATAPALIGIFPFILMFLVASITTLRERTSGTLDRLLVAPISKLDILGGYALSLGSVSVVQVGIAVIVSIPLGLHLGDVTGWFLLVAVVDALLGLALGLLASAFARTEFQAVQFMPLAVFPQLLLCGLFVARHDMAEPLRWLSDVFPMSYAVEGLQRVADSGSVSSSSVFDLLVVVGCAAVALGLAGLSLRRQTD